MNLKLALPLRLFDHMTEQQDKNIVSSNVYGISYKNIITVFNRKIKKGAEPPAGVTIYRVPLGKWKTEKRK